MTTDPNPSSADQAVKAATSTPKTIMQFWAQGTPPEEIANLLATWPEQNPDHTHIVFDRTRAIDFLRENLGERYVEAFLACNLPAMQSDYFRYAYIYHQGGIYVDAATRCMKPLGNWIGYENCHIVRKWHGKLWNGFFAAPARDEFMGRVLEQATKNIENRMIKDIWNATGPGILFTLENQNAIPESTTVVSFEKFRQNVWPVNDLSHKKQNHWSEAQKTTQIYASLTTNNSQ